MSPTTTRAAGSAVPYGFASLMSSRKQPQLLHRVACRMSVPWLPGRRIGNVKGPEGVRAHAVMGPCSSPSTHDHLRLPRHELRLRCLGACSRRSTRRSRRVEALREIGTSALAVWVVLLSRQDSKVGEVESRLREGWIAAAASCVWVTRSVVQSSVQVRLRRFVGCSCISRKSASTAHPAIWASMTAVEKC